MKVNKYYELNQKTKIWQYSTIYKFLEQNEYIPILWFIHLMLQLNHILYFLVKLYRKETKCLNYIKEFCILMLQNFKTIIMLSQFIDSGDCLNCL
jgi:hypothetical protein